MENDKLLELMEDMKKAEQKTVMYQRISAVLILIFVVAILFYLYLYLQI